MAIYYSPKIGDGQQYDALRPALHPHLPATYDEWIGLETIQCGDWLQHGHVIKYIEVDPDEFIRYCATITGRRTLQTLRNFAAAKSGGQQF